MSVTFIVDSPFIGVFVRCACGATASGIYASDCEALAALRAESTGIECSNEPCTWLPSTIETVYLHQDAPRAVLSEDDTTAVLDLLAVDESCSCDPLSGTDLLGRILTASVLPSPAVATAGGREQASAQGVPDSLRDLAEYAHAHDLNVLWG